MLPSSLHWGNFSNFIDNTKRVPKITNVVEQIFFWESDRSLAIYEISYILWNPKFQYCVHQIPQIDPPQSQIS
jgi:hypothetical protein